MFNTVRTEVNARTLVCRQLLAWAQASSAPNPMEVAVCKGLMFVQLYAVYEYTVRSSVQAVLAAIRDDGLCPQQLHHHSLALILDARFASVSTAGRRRVWEQRTGLLTACDSTDSLTRLNDTVFPTDGSHFRAGQLQTIWGIFGLTTSIVPEPRLLGRIEELVENLNAIAHGRRTPEEVGGRYSTLDILKRIDDVEAIMTYLVTQLESHYGSGGVRR